MNGKAIIGQDKIKNAILGRTKLRAMYLGSVKVFPSDVNWEVIAVSVSVLREEVITTASASGGEGVTKVYFKVTETQTNKYDETQVVEKEESLDVKHSFAENTETKQQTQTARTNYRDALGKIHAITGTVKQAAVVWTLQHYYVNYGDSVPKTYAPASGGKGESVLTVSVMGKYKSNTDKYKDELKTKEDITLSYTFDATSSMIVTDHTVTTSYTHKDYGTFQVSGKVYQLQKSTLRIDKVMVLAIPASGGSVAHCDVDFTYNGVKYNTRIYFDEVSADKIPAVERPVTLIDTRTITVYQSDASDSTTISIYQQANVGTTQLDHIVYGVPELSLSGYISASGGSLTASASVTNTAYTYISYTSGAKTDPVGSAQTGSATISISGNSRFSLSGNTISHSSMLDYETTDRVTITAKNDGDVSKKASEERSCTNTKSDVVSETTYGTPTLSLDTSYLTASGGFISVSTSCSNTETYHYEYTSGHRTGDYTRNVSANVDLSILSLKRFSLSGATISHDHMGTDATTDKVYVTAANAGNSGNYTTKEASVTNKVEYVNDYIITEAKDEYEYSLSKISVSLSYDVAPASGATLYPNISWSCTEYVKRIHTSATYYDKYTYTSGSTALGDTLHGGRKTETNSTNTLNTSNHTGYDLTFAYEGDDVDYNSGEVVIPSLGTTPTSNQNIFTECDAYVYLKGRNSRPNGSGYGSSYVYQAANTYEDKTTETFSSLTIVDSSGRTIGTLSSDAQTVFARCVSNVKTVRTFASGSTKTITDKSDYIKSGISMSTYASWYTPYDSSYNTNVNGFVISVSKNTYGYTRSSTLYVSYKGTRKSETISQRT